ncbi:MAG: nitroreductase [Acidimicrobiia bacterium]|nr:nitroreductase [Acidimicrobiia bacterium]MYE73164.1 nitroreductase [Acidimicrobiia bacterium]MYJ61818.1 nitroreductase [Acidimicrobiia bacterium]
MNKATAEVGVFEAMHTQRAVRRYRTDPVPDELVTQVLDAAIRAPSAINGQFARFVVVTDPEKRLRLGELYLDAQEEAYNNPAAAGTEWLRNQEAAIVEKAAKFAREIGDVPVLIIVCSTQRGVSHSIYPAVQNLLVAARSLGLGTVLTTLHTFRADEVREVLGIPDDIHIVCGIPMGWPAVPFGPVRRRPLSEVCFWNEWEGSYEQAGE